MRFQTRLAKRFGTNNPIIQAPMAGGATTIDLVAAVAEAGAMGFFGAAYNTPEQIAELSKGVRERTDRPFGINLFAPIPEPPAKDPAPMTEAIAAYHRDLGLPAPPYPRWEGDTFDGQLEAALASGASVLSFTFGMLPQEAVAAVKGRGMMLLGTATTVEEAILLERLGVDAVVAQGSEAGAHRGTFAGEFEDAMIGTLALVPQVVDAVSVPVVASGGIMDGRGIAAALTLGAEAVQMGTAFLTCAEAGIPRAHKDALLSAREDSTRVTRAFSGRPARGIVNSFMREVEMADSGARLLPFPLQNTLTRPLRSAAAGQGRPEYLSLWAGQGVRMARQLPAAALVAQLMGELEEAVERLAQPGRRFNPSQ
ncbi:MAG: nitronate monooxygenase [Trueperaceae bacterium]